MNALQCIGYLHSDMQISIITALLSLVVGLVITGFFAYIRAPDFLCHVLGFASSVATLYALGAFW